ncbi:MAG: InlB B-repeat-containing protein [Treponema sp.]
MTKFMKHSGQSGSVRKIGKKMALLLGVTLAALLSFSCKQDASNDGDDNSPKTFDIVYELDGGTNHADNPKKYSTDKLPVELKAPSKTDFTFEGWYKEKGFKNKVEKIEKGITGKLTFYAKWSEIPSTSYTVIHLWQPVTGDTYVEHERETPSGKVGAETTAAAKNYPGFHVSTVQHTGGKILQQKITADGKTVVKVYYDRDMFTAKFNTDGGNKIEERSCRYETEILPPATPIKDGFTFIGWEPTLPAKLMADTEYKATWTAEPLQEYKVEHWRQKIDTATGKACNESTKNSTCYELQDTDTQNGKKGEQTQAAAKDYPGFVKPQASDIIQETIKEVKKDEHGIVTEQTVVKIYYVRKTVTLTFDAKGGKIGTEDQKTLSGKYGEKIESNAVPNPLRNNADKFSEWKPVKPTAFPEKDTTYDAQWETLSAIEIEMLTSPIEYFEGAKFNPANIKVKAKYSGSNPVLTYDTEYKTNFDTIKNNVGNNQTVTVWHAKDTAKKITATFTVNIKARTPEFSAGDVIDTINNKKIKAVDFTAPAVAAQWDKYYVIIKQEGTKYIAVRYLDNSGYGDPELRSSPSNTYPYNAKPADPDRYLKPEDITAIVTNKVAVKESMDKIKTISGLSAYTNENCISSTDNGYNFTDGNGNPAYSGSFIPFAAREFN